MPHGRLEHLLNMLRVSRRRCEWKKGLQMNAATLNARERLPPCDGATVP